MVLDNSGALGPPVIVETTPTFLNLFGTIERAQDPRTGDYHPCDDGHGRLPWGGAHQAPCSPG